MTQRDRDRLVVLKKAQKKLISQKQAAAELQLTERQVRRLLKGLKANGDKAVVHALRSRPSNRKLSSEVRAKVMSICCCRNGRDLDRRWPAIIWPKITGSESAARRCGR